MKKWLHKIEVIVDKLIPCMLVLLLIILTLEIGFHRTAERYHIYIQIADYFVVTVFVLDLVFKYIRIRKVPTFLKKCWLDIIAVFPFFLAFRILEGTGLFTRIFGEGVSTAQGVLHEGVEIEKEASRLMKTIEKEGATAAREAGEIARISRAQKIARIVKPVLRAPRFAKALSFFEKPTGGHHPHEQKAAERTKKAKRF